MPNARPPRDSASLRIVPNTENNSLLIYASPSEFAIVEAALKRLDVIPIQVLIEASVAEVTLSDSLRWGLQWSSECGDGRATPTAQRVAAAAPARRAQRPARRRWRK
jgi:general secretion pathway protein D